MSFSISGSNTWRETALILTDGERLSSASMFAADAGGAIGVLMDRTRYNRERLRNDIPDHLDAVHDGWLNISLASPAYSGSNFYRFVTGSLELPSPNTDLTAMGWLQSGSVGVVNIDVQISATGSMVWHLGGLPVSGSIDGLKVYANGGSIHNSGSIRSDTPASMPRFQLIRNEWSTATSAMSATIILDVTDYYSGTIGLGNFGTYIGNHVCTYNMGEGSLLNAERSYYLRYSGESGANSRQGSYLLRQVMVHVTGSVEGAS